MKFNLMTVDKFSIIDKSEKIIYEQKNIKNILHSEGEEFIIKSIFSSSVAIPSSYYVGLDFRNNLTKADSMQSIYLEPNTGNYRRQEIASNSWVVSNSTGTWIAKSPSIVFSAIGNGWGPVKNIFLTTVEEGKSGKYIISSSALQQNVSLNAGQKIVLEISLSIFSNAT